MTPERWQQIREVFGSAVEREPGERASFVKEVCAGDEDLRREVESLLASYERDGSFLEQPAFRVADEIESADRDVLSAGQSISHYEVISLIGEGGMGEVYLARDERLGRRVALKLLPARFTTDRERLRRFELEARATSALNHPNILTIYEIGRAGGTDFIAAEFVDGVTLRQRMAEARMKLSEVLDVAAQVASALAAAHASGIVHRDIKPENIMLRRDGLAKVLDFGLAKLTEQSIDPEASTRAAVMTGTGVVMGTVGYMSPEQVRGLTADHRSDIFSFGAVLYEMLSGRRAFQGDSGVETLSAILKEDPPELTIKNSRIAPALERVVRHCLEKDQARRFQSAADIAFALESVAGLSGIALKHEVGAPAQAVNRERLAWVLAGVLLLAAVVFAGLYFRRGAAETRVVRFLVAPPEKGVFQFKDFPYSVAVSPDGKRLALAAWVEGQVPLWVRPIAESAPQPLADTEGAEGPFWSPDSRFIGFFAGGKIKKVEATGGPPQTLCDAPPGSTAASWGRGGTILIAAGTNGIFLVPAGGGEPLLVTKPDSSRREYAYFWPHFLPDGRRFLFFSANAGRKRNEILTGSLDSKETKFLMQADSRAVYAVPGYLLYVNDGTLLAHPFDVEKLGFRGEALTVAENLRYFRPTGNADFSVSENGVLAYQSGAIASRLTWLDRGGAEVGSVGAPADYDPPRLSPDGQKLATSIHDHHTGETDIWLYDLSRGAQSRIASEPGMENFPIWSPDGGQIVFAASRDAAPHLHLKALNDDSSGKPLVQPGNLQFPNDWAETPGGQFIIYEDWGADTGRDLMILPMFGERKPRPFLRTRFNEHDARFSPDGERVAYMSNESGRDEVYVRPLQGSGEKWLISTSGGAGPRWSRDGKELFYLAADGMLKAVPVKTGNSVEDGTPTPLFHVESKWNMYEVTADGRRFLVTANNTPPLPITVVLNWTADLKR